MNIIRTFVQAISLVAMFAWITLFLFTAPANAQDRKLELTAVLHAGAWDGEDLLLTGNIPALRLARGDLVGEDFNIYVRIGNYRDFDSDERCEFDAYENPWGNVGTLIVCDTSGMALAENVSYRIRLIIRNKGVYRLADDMSVFLPR